METVCISETLISIYESRAGDNFSPEDEDSMFLRNVDIYLRV
jgi:hypothetical protein